VRTKNTNRRFPALLLLLAGSSAAAAQSIPAIAAEGGPQALDVSGYIQFRYTATFPEGEEAVIGFQLPRVRLKFTADLSERLSVVVEGGLESGTMDLKDAFIRLSPNDGLNIRAGQYKLPFTRETIMADSSTLLITPSTVNAVFGLGRGQGIAASWEADRVRLMGSVSDGGGTDNTNYADPEEAGVALTARAELRLGQADWGRYNTFTSFRGSDPGVMIGAAVHWQGGEDGASPDEPGAPERFLAATADISYEGDGHTAFLAGHWRRSDELGESYDDFGLVAHAGVFVSDRTELFGRYGVVFADGDRTGDDTFEEFAIGVNHYFIPESLAAKFSFELAYHPDGTDDFELVSASSERGLVAGDDAQLTFRAQIQLMF